MTDTITQTKTCAHCTSSFEITQGDMDFYEKISPVFGDWKAQIPTPNLCPDCRQRRRLSFRNERKLYKRKCDASGKDIISIYSPNKKFKVYDQKIWWSDSRNPMDYGFEFNFNTSFTEDFKELMSNIPHLSLLGLQNEESDYVNGVFAAKNSYLCFNCDYIESCLYIQNSIHIKDSLDCMSCMNSSELYMCLVCDNCYNCSYCVSCQDCSHCYQCDNLIGKQYHIQNIPYSKSDYFKKILNTEHGLRKTQVIDIHAHKNNRCENIHDCQNLEDCKNCYYVYNSKDCMDFDIFGDQSCLIYEGIAIGPQGYQNLFCNCVWGGSISCLYSLLLSNCKYCFACIGLRNKQYCIFNRQYTKEEYNEIVPKIIQHMTTTGERGEFFHTSLSPFAYNETMAQEHYPLDYESSQKLGYTRSTYESPTLQVSSTILGTDLPESIHEVQDDILKIAITCEVSAKPFRITTQELAFYRKHNIPLPRKHPDIRHTERMKLRK